MDNMLTKRTDIIDYEENIYYYRISSEIISLAYKAKTLEEFKNLFREKFD